MSGIIYQIEHETVFNYSDEIAESVMEVRVYPKEDSQQRSLSFQLRINPHVATHQYLDYLGNVIHHFNIPDLVKELVVLSRAVVEVFPNQQETELTIKTSWDSLNKVCVNPSDDIWDMLQASHFVLSTDLLKQLIIDLDLSKLENPFATVTNINSKLNSYFSYEQNSTKVDSPIDDALTLKAGVCQDFTNILLQMVRMCGIPARYVSGYICPTDDISRGEGATHAWIEAYIPFYGWLGLDPTNNAIANENHVRLAVGRNYDDCSPVKGVFKRKVESDLFVKVEVSTTKRKEASKIPPNTFTGSETNNSYQRNLERIQQQQSQQSQQQQQQQQQ